MGKLKSFLEHQGYFSVIAVLFVVGAVAYFLMSSDGATSLVGEVNEQTFIDLDGNTFSRKLVAFDTTPIVGPTGKPAFRAEMCFWTRDGKTKVEPTPVLLNSHAGLPEPTFCPDCTRLVVALNPPPLLDVPESEQRRPPPTRDDMSKPAATSR